MQVILLERVENLGGLGEVVSVKPGYARNFLIPQQKALRATKDNIAYFEVQKKEIEKVNDAKRKDAEKEAKKIEGIKVALIRHASESGQLYGSVNARDISDAIIEETKVQVAKSMITLNDALKTIGLFEVTVALHPEVKSTVTVNIARTADEAREQAKTGRALIAGVSYDEPEEPKAPESDDMKEAFLEEDALEADKERVAAEEVAAAEDAEKKAAGDAKAAEKAAAAKAARAEEEALAAEGEADSETEEKKEA
jgi:large subunit ribosomal protein L9